MTPQRFELLAAAYGSDLRRWPEEERAAARALVAADPGLLLVLRAESRLDVLLDELAALPPSPAFADRIAAIPERLRLLRRSAALGGLSRLAAAALLALAIGMLAGTFSAQRQGAPGAMRLDPVMQGIAGFDGPA